MTLGLSLPVFTAFHVIVSLIGIGSGLLVATQMLQSRLSAFWNAIFLASTLVTALTGFLFPVQKVLPSHVVGVLTTIALLVAIAAWYLFKLHAPWRRTYIVCALMALYFNVFVAIVQAFEKIAVLRAIAPTQSAPAFLIAQLAVMACFCFIGVLAFRRAGMVSAEAI